MIYIMIVQCNDNDMIKYIVFVECFNEKLNRVNMTQYDITVNWVIFVW